MCLEEWREMGSKVLWLRGMDDMGEEGPLEGEMEKRIEKSTRHDELADGCRGACHVPKGFADSLIFKMWALLIHVHHS